MRYFDNQKYDEAGIVGVKLQKVILALMIFHLSSFFWGFGIATFVGTICMIALLFIGFKGASKRNPKYLRAYCVGSVVYIVGSILLVLLGVAFFMFYQPQFNNGGDVVTPPSPPSNDTDVVPVSAVDTDPSTPVPVDSDSDSTFFDVQPAPPTMVPDVEGGFCWGFVFLGVGLLIGLIVFALHIASIVMASRMHRYLIATAAQNLAHPRKQTAEPQVVMPTPSMIPVQVQPNNFGYYPMYSMNPTNIQNAQQFYFNPYLQPVQYYPQNPQGNPQV